MNEHEFEATPGLPERLPEGERLLWQGSPSWRALALRAYHVREVAAYFALLAAWHAFDTVRGGTDWSVALRGVAWLLVLGLAASGVLAALAWAQARSTIYTITTARIVMRFGVALPISMNLPFRLIESAGVVSHTDGTADLPVTLARGEHVGYLITWPHVRPWHPFRVQPTLRSLPDGRHAAEILAAALAATVHDAVVTPATRPVREAVNPPRPTVTAAA